MAMTKLREELARKFLEALGQGQLPWAVCWRQGRPINAVTGKYYRGVNALLLSSKGDEAGYEDPRWCTYQQAQGRGWQVRRGEKGEHAEFWSYYDKLKKELISPQEAAARTLDKGYRENIRVTARTYVVFNAAQIAGIPELASGRTDIGRLRGQRDILLRNMGVGYREYGSEAYYTPSQDTVTLPKESSFDDAYSYMATLLHECGHATGHPSRLGRDLSGAFGSESYAREELRAEIASAFTAQAIGLRLTENQLQAQTLRHAAYIQSWADRLRNAPEELFAAIKSAGEISDYLLEQGAFLQEHTMDAPLQSPRRRMELAAENPGMTREALARLAPESPAPELMDEPEIEMGMALGM